LPPASPRYRPLTAVLAVERMLIERGLSFPVGGSLLVVAWKI